MLLRVFEAIQTQIEYRTRSDTLADRMNRHLETVGDIEGHLLP